MTTLELEPVGLFALLALTIYRLARLITIDDGPGDAILKFRNWIGAYDYAPNGLAKSSLGRGITCPYCVGMWVALVVSLIVLGWRVETLFYWLALAGAQSFLQSLSR